MRDNLTGTAKLFGYGIVRRQLSYYLLIPLEYKFRSLWEYR